MEGCGWRCGTPAGSGTWPGRVTSYGDGLGDRLTQKERLGNRVGRLRGGWDGPTGAVTKTGTKRRYYLGSVTTNHLFEHLSAQNHVPEQQTPFQHYFSPIPNSNTEIRRHIQYVQKSWPCIFAHRSSKYAAWKYLRTPKSQTVALCQGPRDWEMHILCSFLLWHFPHYTVSTSNTCFNWQLNRAGSLDFPLSFPDSLICLQNSPPVVRNSLDKGEVC